MSTEKHARTKPLSIEEEQCIRVFYENKLQGVCNNFRFPRQIQIRDRFYLIRINPDLTPPCCKLTQGLAVSTTIQEPCKRIWDKVNLKANHLEKEMNDEIMMSLNILMGGRHIIKVKN
ncbi:hypothetical protein Fmac_020350 [Flemingia macrophylla]|uniref:Uncharacterized protein n=1 Tax=Flemingia macrophylla TaxID=520843 RepID=A0ABD1LTR0_9FABA